MLDYDVSFRRSPLYSSRAEILRQFLIFFLKTGQVVPKITTLRKNWIGRNICIFKGGMANDGILWPNSERNFKFILLRVENLQNSQFLKFISQELRKYRYEYTIGTFDSSFFFIVGGGGGGSNVRLIYEMVGIDSDLRMTRGILRVDLFCKICNFTSIIQNDANREKSVFILKRKYSVRFISCKAGSR